MNFRLHLREPGTLGSRVTPPLLSLDTPAEVGEISQTNALADSEVPIDDHNPATRSRPVKQLRLRYYRALRDRFLFAPRVVGRQRPQSC